MASRFPDPNRPIELALSLDASSPHLLEGLEAWLQLGLISDRQVRSLCQKSLTCRLPSPVPISESAEEEGAIATPVPALTNALTAVPPQRDRGREPDADGEFAPASPRPASTTKATRFARPTPVRSPSFFDRIGNVLQSLVAELSVVWLLFLGVFLVILSSAVLAASQWQRFAATGQYLILLAYTVGFWLTSHLARRRETLTLTARSLQLIVLLLLPVNFWAMDELGLWASPLQWGIVAIAAVILGAIALAPLARPPSTVAQRIALGNLLGLSILHWGWNIPVMPLGAIYLGTIGTTLVTLYRQRWHRLHPARTNAASPENPEDAAAPESVPLAGGGLGKAMVTYAAIALLVRGILIAGVEVTQLGLALGICGWLLAWLPESASRPNRETTTAKPDTAVFFTQMGEALGGLLLFLGWLVSVGTPVPWQAAIVSVLIVSLLWQRLYRFGQPVNLVAILAIGLQTIWLGWRLIPAELQGQAIRLGTQLADVADTPWVLLSVVLLPYVAAIAIWADRFYHQQRRSLALTAEWLGLCFAVVLTSLGVVNPCLRSINLLLSAAGLGGIAIQRARFPQEKRPGLPVLVYLTHFVGLMALVATLRWQWPNLTLVNWISFLLVTMTVEWGISLLLANQLPEDGTPRRPLRWWWGTSSWHMGLVLGLFSYYSLLIQLFLSAGNTTLAAAGDNWRWLGLVPPLALTAFASLSRLPRRDRALWFSSGSLFVAQVLTLGLLDMRLTGLGIATVLMVVNSVYLRQVAAAAIAVGFGLSFIAVGLGQGVLGLPAIADATWFLVGAITILVLWGLHSGLQRFASRPLVRAYARAVDGWAIFLWGAEVFSLTLHCFGRYQGVGETTFVHPLANLLLAAALIYRQRSRPTNWLVWLVSGVLELAIAEAVQLYGGTALHLAVANVGLGAVLAIAGEWWRRRSSLLWSLEFLPILFAALSLVLRADYANAWTGGLTLVAAGIGLLIGRRKPTWYFLAYLALAAISAGIYELVIYQMRQAPGGNPADGLTILAAVATALAWIYRGGATGLARWLRLPVAAFRITAHSHWGLGSAIAVLAAVATPGTNPSLAGLSLGLSSLLTLYAIWQGRLPNQPSTSDGTGANRTDTSLAALWIYVGFIGMVGCGVYARLIWPQLAGLAPWGAAIAAIVAFGLHQAPWQRWGWEADPWQRASLVLPLAIALMTANEIHAFSLATVAALYALLARIRQQTRLVYLSFGLATWLFWREFSRLELSDPLWYLFPLSSSLLAVAQIDPLLRQPNRRTARHQLRLAATSLICLPALVMHQETGLLPGGIGIVLLFAGLILKVRAFLLIGTGTFLITAFYQLILFSYEYPLFKWAVGLLIGIAFIWIAATFENRRSQIKTLVRSWLTELQEWE